MSLLRRDFVVVVVVKYRGMGFSTCILLSYILYMLHRFIDRATLSTPLGVCGDLSNNYPSRCVIYDNNI